MSNDFAEPRVKPHRSGKTPCQYLKQPLLAPFGALDAHRAAQYLGFKDGRVMERLPIPRADLALPGARRPRWSWLVDDLDEFLASRRVQPGFPSPWSGIDSAQGTAHDSGLYDKEGDR